MLLHLIKLCVGADSIADLEDWIDGASARARSKAGGQRRTQHTTRMVPKRADELCAGGSLYWVIKGQVSARQRLLDVEPFIDTDGIGRCRCGSIPNSCMPQPASLPRLPGLALS